MNIWVYEIKAAAVTVVCMWVAVDGDRASVGRVVSGHRTEDEARREADRIGGCYESADIMAMVQSGVSYTDAVQAHAGRDRRPAKVTVEGARRVWYAYLDESRCREDAAARIAQGEDVSVREYERVSGGMATLYVPHMTHKPGQSCRCGYATLREAHDDGGENVHGYAVVDEQATPRERSVERVRMGWAEPRHESRWGTQGSSR